MLALVEKKNNIPIRGCLGSAVSKLSQFVALRDGINLDVYASESSRSRGKWE